MPSQTILIADSIELIDAQLKGIIKFYDIIKLSFLGSIQSADQASELNLK